MQNNWEIHNGVIYWKGEWRDGNAVVTIDGKLAPVDLIAKLMHVNFSTIAKYGEQHAGLEQPHIPGDLEDSGDGTGESPE